MTVLDTKMAFTLKDLIMLVGFLGAGFGGYYSVTSEIESLKNNQVDIVSDIAMLEQKDQAYASLPRDVETLKADVKANAELTKAIYIGLVAKGIIKPPQ